MKDGAHANIRGYGAISSYSAAVPFAWELVVAPSRERFRIFVLCEGPWWLQVLDGWSEVYLCVPNARQVFFFFEGWKFGRTPRDVTFVDRLRHQEKGWKFASADSAIAVIYSRFASRGGGALQ
jgi:hypothetical protein